MSIDDRFPYDINDVPNNRVLGGKRVVRTPTGKMVTTPGGHQASPVDEKTRGVDPNAIFCDPLPVQTVKQQPHLEPTFESQYVHAQNCAIVEPQPIPDPINMPTIQIVNFPVPVGYVLFVEKLLFKLYDSSWDTIQFIPQRNGCEVEEFHSFNHARIHLPTLPQGQRNVRIQINGPDQFSIAVRNLTPFVQRRVCTAFVGWLERLRYDEIAKR
jgi:hypothetical protein